jgi:hypothetical protein
MSDAVFMDCMNTTLSFTLTYSVSAVPSAITGARCKLLSSAASWFDTLVLNEYGTENLFYNNRLVIY